MELDKKRRDLIQKVESLKAQRNDVSDKIAFAKRQKEDASEAILQMKQVGADIKSLDNEQTLLDGQVREIAAHLLLMYQLGQMNLLT